ncbi:MAG TPA: agmatine deiminase family protein [Terriglobales bacterium]|nr:agmatine deiminase family protein [Terriglobales bacterium]
MKRKQNRTPQSLGYRMPAEWEPHEGTWLGWPHNQTDWPGKFQPIPWVYADIVYHLAQVERVRILVNSQAAEDHAREVLQRANALRETVEFLRWPTNRGWTRDSGPIFVRNDGPRARGSARRKKKDGAAPVAVVNFRFNAWAKYNDWKLDNAIPGRAARHLKVPEFSPRIGEDGAHMVLEGGSIDVNGFGSMLTTEECLLSDVQQRNPGATREDLERAFAEYLGVTNTIWLGSGIVGDDTHGHVDDVARFVAPDVVVCASEPDPADANYEPLADNLRRLREAATETGRQLRVVELPMPRPIIHRGRRLPASYANFYIANRLVLVPTFNDRNDRVALNTLAELFPDRDVVGIHCGDLVWGLGTLHCMTQQQPG